MEEEKLLIIHNYYGAYYNSSTIHGFIKLPIVKDTFIFYINGTYEDLYVIDTFVYHNELKKHIPIIIGTYGLAPDLLENINKLRHMVIYNITNKLKDKILDLNKYYRKSKIQKILKDSESK